MHGAACLQNSSETVRPLESSSPWSAGSRDVPRLVSLPCHTSGVRLPNFIGSRPVPVNSRLGQRAGDHPHQWGVDRERALAAYTYIIVCE